MLNNRNRASSHNWIATLANLSKQGLVTEHQCKNWIDTVKNEKGTQLEILYNAYELVISKYYHNTNKSVILYKVTFDMKPATN